MEQLEEGQIILCTVDKILGTTVFVKIDNTNLEGTITFPEIAPGRIRNIREYVVPGKKIVCKILSIKQTSIHLSFRRVKPSERKELLDKISKEASYKAILKTALGPENSIKIIEKITQDYTLPEFFEQIKNNPKRIEEYLNKQDSEKILKILESKKEKLKEIKQIFKISNKSSNGMPIVKNILQESCKGTRCEINYLAAGKYSLTLKGEDFKVLKNESNKVLENIEKQAKKTHSEFSLEKA